MHTRRHWTRFMSRIMFGTACALPLGAMAQPAPLLNKPVKIVVGFTPGGSADLIARALAGQLAAYAPGVIVENKPGAGGRIALEAVKNAEPDGSTLLVTPSSVTTLYPHVYRKLSYDPLKDLAPVSMLASFPFVLVAGPMVPAQVATLRDFIAWSRANPRQAAFASPGNGTTPHFAGIALNRAGNLDLTHVAYKGGAPAMNDVMGGQIASNMAVISNALPHIQAGKVRALAVTGPVRSAALPAVPTMTEAGYPDASVTESFGLYLPAKTAPETVLRLNALVREAMATKAYQDVLVKSSFDAAPVMNPTDYAQQIKAETARWASIVKASGFTPED